MPGINCLIRSEGIPETLIQSIGERSKSYAVLLPHIETRISRICPQVLLMTTSHIHYQVYESRLGNWYVYHENQTDACFSEALASLLGELQENSAAPEDLIRIWTKHIGAFAGGFLCLAVNPTLKLLIYANDSLSRLPVYVNRTQAGISIGRDIDFIKAACEPLHLNPLYLALYQMFSYVPGRGSFYNELDTLKGGTIALYDWHKDSLIQATQPNLRFVEINHDGDKRKRLKSVTDSFLDATATLAQGSNNVLALSGGFDSRTIAAALSRQQIPFETATYVDTDKTAADDYLIANTTASILNTKHSNFQLADDTTQEFHKLFRMKGGLNHLGMAFFVQFLELLQQRYPQKVLFITGDGGDKVFPDLRPKRKLKTSVELIDYICQNNAYFSQEFACNLLGVSTKSIQDYLLALIDKYPGKNYMQSYKHFLLSERAGRWLFEGEDRNRYYFRSETPFYDLPFYKLALQIPDAWKSDNSFYSSMLKQLSPELARLRLANSRMIPALLTFSPYRQALNLRRKLTLAINLRGKKTQPQPAFQGQADIIARILTSSVNTDLRNTLLNPDHIFNGQYLNKLNRTQLYIIYSLVSIIINDA